MYRRLLLIGLVLALCIVLPAAATVADGACEGTTTEERATAFAVITASDFVAQNGYEKVADLIAGGGNLYSAMDVGDVLVDLDCDSGILNVKYAIIDQTPEDPFDDWYLTETHLQVADSLAGIPQAKGNPIPGRFDDATYHDSVTEYSYAVDISGIPCGETLYIAAHAVVKDPCGLDGLELALPDQVTIKPVNYPNADSYFDLQITSGGFLDGTVDSWCIDELHYIYINYQYTANVYSSYEQLPENLLTDQGDGNPHIDKEENLDLVNWVINQPFIGQIGPGGMIITSTDVQNAIWNLIDDAGGNCPAGSNCAAIVAAAYASPVAEGFVPGCGDHVAIIFAPVNGEQVVIGQVVIGGAEVPCDACGSETAWGAVPGMVVIEKKKSLPGYQFPGSDWATYFTIDGCDCVD